MPPVPSPPSQQEPARPPGWEPLARLAKKVKRPLEWFLAIQAASGVLLIVAALVALAWANSPWAASYTSFWHTPIGATAGGIAFERSLAWFVNDVLMAIFFFVVGLEIRREIAAGELSEARRAALPVLAALGGMLVPAGIYLVLADSGAARTGWGVPMATDIAFALGVLALLGNRVPAALRVLLLALAVIDDLGAIVVIALFYSAGIDLAGLGWALGGLGAILALQRLGVRAKGAYALVAPVVWVGVYLAGIHPTIAGVVVGLVTPVRRVASEARAPAESLIDALHPWVAFAIMPIFALANAGVAVTGGFESASSWSVAAGVAAGLVLGKPCGVLLASWLALKLELGVLPRGLSVRHLVVLGLVAGIGFTMSLFVAQLAFRDPELLTAAKVGVLGASVLAGVLALAVGRALLPLTRAVGAAETADEAEASTEL